VREKIVDALKQCISLALDAALLDANAADPGLRPAGLRHAIAALSASAAADPVMAMLADVSAVAASVAPVSGNSPIVLVADPVHAMMLRVADRCRTKLAFARVRRIDRDCSECRCVRNGRCRC
jgi:hypothetical protein